MQPKKYVVQRMSKSLLFALLVMIFLFIQSMFQDIITNGTDVKTAAKTAEDKLNALFETAE